MKVKQSHSKNPMNLATFFDVSILKMNLRSGLKTSFKLRWVIPHYTLITNLFTYILTSLLTYIIVAYIVTYILNSFKQMLPTFYYIAHILLGPIMFCSNKCYWDFITIKPTAWPNICYCLITNVAEILL